MPTPLDALGALEHVIASKSGGAPRAGQQQMAAAIETALAGGDVLLVEAGTGTGKSFAYLIPAILHSAGEPDRRVVIATATKALQEQLVTQDLPFLADTLAARGIQFTYALLKGRSNYLCQAKVGLELSDLGPASPLTDDIGTVLATGAQVDDVRTWAEQTTTGDWAEIQVPGPLRARLSSTGDDCPGRSGCPVSDGCFYFAAKDRAATADLVVANTALYGAHLASGGRVLPDHSVVVVDEAHTVAAVMTDAFGVTLSGSRLRVLASRLRRAMPDRMPLVLQLRACADDLANLLDGYTGERVRTEDHPWPVVFERVSHLAAETLEAAETAGATGAPADTDAQAKVAMVATMATNLRASMETLAAADPGTVSWVEEDSHGPRLRQAPSEIGPILARTLFAETTVIATSATLTTAGAFDPVAHSWGLDPADISAERVPSPFDYRRQAILYVPAHLPVPGSSRYTDAMHDELTHLAEAAGGRTLALFTSRRAMTLAAEHLTATTALRVLVQDEMPREELLAEFTSGPGQVLCATSSYWTGVDIPGPALLLTVIDKIPFPRKEDPLVDARRAAANRRGRNPFDTVDLPEAARDLAQGAGRLIRTTSDQGVVAVLDSRMRTKSYGRTLRRSLPEFYDTADLSVAASALRRLATQTDSMS